MRGKIIIDDEAWRIIIKTETQEFSVRFGSLRQRPCTCWLWEEEENNSGERPQWPLLGTAGDLGPDSFRDVEDRYRHKSILSLSSLETTPQAKRAMPDTFILEYNFDLDFSLNKKIDKWFKSSSIFTSSLVWTSYNTNKPLFFVYIHLYDELHKIGIYASTRSAARFCCYFKQM